MEYIKSYLLFLHFENLDTSTVRETTAFLWTTATNKYYFAILHILHHVWTVLHLLL